MAFVQNTSTITEFRSAAGIPANEPIPQSINSSIQPVLNINPKDYRVTTHSINTTLSTTGGSNFFTSSASRDTFLTGCMLSLVKNATCDASTGAFSVLTTCGGRSTSLATMPLLTLTAQDKDVFVVFNPPLKMDRNVVVNLPGSFTAGTMVRSCVLFYYEVEPQEA